MPDDGQFRAKILYDSPMPLADGAEFAGYTIERLLGTGGMGEVYLVRHPRLPRREALKILPQNVSADQGLRQRFAREADIAASLWHPHIVAVHERGEYEGQLWITMDFVEGTDAARLVRDRYPSGMPPHGAFEIVTAIAEALDYAHERKTLHRDVKPANILLTDPSAGDRRILLADFGIARAVDDALNLTATNMAVGSVAYAAPEQLTGKPLDRRADQYALACTAFHLLTGDPPFGNSAPVAIGCHLYGQIPQLRSGRADLGVYDDVFAMAMAKEPQHRFNSCRAFAAALTERSVPPRVYAEATQFAAPPAPTQPVVQPWVAPPTTTTNQVAISRRAATIAAGVAALVAVGLVAFFGARLGQSDSTTSSTSSSRSSLIGAEPTVGSRDRETVTAPPVTVTRPGQPPAAAPIGDLGLRTPMSTPACDGQGIVVLGNITTPGQYPSGIQQLLNQFPGASYLRTDQSCPSLRHASDEGNPIYTVYRLAGTTQAQICAAVRSAGGDAYGKWLDTKTPPSYIIPC
jgi:serine/threonine protein kinase, bacterial